MASQRVKAAVAAVVFAAVLAGVGYASIASSSYKSVTDLLASSRPVKATIQAGVAPLGSGVYTLEVDGRVYIVEARGTYGVARGDDGRVYAVFLVTDGRHAALAIYDATGEYAAYQAGWSLSTTVVLGVTYEPGATATLRTPTGSLSLPLVTVNSILKGCHSSYGQGAATTR